MPSSRVLIGLSFIISLSVAQVPTLLEVLQSSGASQFAALIESDPTISALYLSSQVQTVFAPSDGSKFPSSTKGNGKRQPLTPAQEQLLGLQVTQQQNNLSAMSVPPGVPLPTQDKTGNLGGNPQSVVSDTVNTPASQIPKRWSNTTTPPSLLKIFSGLGNNVSITRADIPYAGGLVHIVNNFFTLPESLSATAVANGHTTFTSLTNSSNLTAILDNTPSITCFIPTNAAFASSNTTSSSSTSNMISGFVIPNFVGYLPSLKNGSTYTTRAGTTVTVTVQGSDYYINNAKIIGANMILENGVAHVVDQVIKPVVVSFHGAASSVMGGSAHFAVLASSLVLLLGLVL